MKKLTKAQIRDLLASLDTICMEVDYTVYGLPIETTRVKETKISDFHPDIYDAVRSWIDRISKEKKNGSK